MADWTPPKTRLEAQRRFGRRISVGQWERMTRAYEIWPGGKRIVLDRKTGEQKLINTYTWTCHRGSAKFRRKHVREFLEPNGTRDRYIRESLGTIFGSSRDWLDALRASETEQG
jgi:hypothetical protein